MQHITSSKNFRISLKRRALWLRTAIVFVTVSFLVLASFKSANSQLPNQSTPVPIPGQSTPVIVAPPPLFIVQLDSNGRTYINGKPILHNNQKPTLDDPLARALQDFSTANQCGVMVVSASQSTKYSLVTELIDLFRRVGAERMALGFPPYPKDGAFTPVSMIFELNQLAPPTIGSLYPSRFPNCSRQPFELPGVLSKPAIPLEIPKIPTIPPLPLPPSR
jgi:biopolymer transport protein ExbD